MSTDTDPWIRRAAAEDLPLLMRFHRQLNPDDVARDPERLGQVLAEILGRPYFEFLIAGRGRTALGTCYVNVIPNLTRGGSPYGLIENVIVDEAARGRGVGKALMRAALNRAWERGCYKVMLQTGVRSEALFRFYERCGFLRHDKVSFVARAGQAWRWPSC